MVNASGTYNDDRYKKKTGHKVWVSCPTIIVLTIKMDIQVITKTTKYIDPYFVIWITNSRKLVFSGQCHSIGFMHKPPESGTL